MIAPYGWPCSAISREEMAILVKWRGRLNLPITKIIKMAVIEWDKREEKTWEGSEVEDGQPGVGSTK